MHPVDELPRVRVHGRLVRHRAVEAVVLGDEVLLHDAQHELLFVHGVLVGAAEGVVRLQLRFRGGHARVRHGHGTAGDVLLLEQDDGLPGFQQPRRRDKARGPGTHERHVHLGGLRGAAAGGRGAQAVIFRIAAGVRDGVGHGGLDGHRSGGGSGDGVHIEVLGFQDARGHHRRGSRTDADRVVAAQHAHTGDVAASHGHLHVQRVVVAHGRADPLAVGEAFGDVLLRFGPILLVVRCLLRRGASGQGAERGDAAERERPLEKVPAIKFHGCSLLTLDPNGFGVAGRAPLAAAPLALGRIRRAHPGCGLVLPEGRIRTLVPPLPCGVDGFQYGAREGEGRHRPWVLFGAKGCAPLPDFRLFFAFLLFTRCPSADQRRRFPRDHASSGGKSGYNSEGRRWRGERVF